MVASLREALDFKTYLSPGQQFASSEDLGPANAGALTVARLVKDRLGLLHVTLRDERGREISAFAEQVEAAIAEGHLFPMAAMIGSV